MTVVQSVARAPGGAPLKKLRVKITLCTGRGALPGYTSNGDIIGPQYVTTDDNGAWSIDLTPNSTITPANTYYRVVEASTVTTIVVLASGGPYQLIDVLSTPPPTPSAPGLTGVNVSVGGTLKGKRGGVNLIAGTNTTISGTDNSAQDRVDVTVTATGGGGGGSGSVNSVNGQTPDGSGNVVVTAAEVGAIASSTAGAANGTATLDASGHLTPGQDANLVKSSQLGASSGVATLDSSGHLTAGQDANLLKTSQLGANSGVASLDSSGHLTAAQAANLVDLSSTQTIAGVKSFSSSPTVPTPVGSTDVVNKAYADAIALGLSVKSTVQEATAAALPANTYANGASGVGATLTGNANGALTVDGIAVTAGDRVLVQNEATAASNGIYAVTAAGGSGAPYVLTRASDMNTPAEIPGAFVFVEQGTANAGAGFVVASKGPVTIGTTAIAWTQFSGAGEILAGTGLTKTGNTIAANIGTTSGTLAAGNDSRITGAAQKSANLGDVADPIASRGNIGAAGRLTPTAVKTAAYTGQAGELVIVDATAGNVPITLVSAPADGTVIAVKMITTSGGHTATITCGGTDVFNKTGGSTTATLTLTAQAILLQYAAATGIWYVVGDDLPLAQLDTRYVAKVSPVTLTDAATIATDASLGNLMRVTLGGNRTLGNPTNAVDGQLVTWMVKQDGTGSRTLTMDTKFRFGSDITSITLTTTPGKTDHIGARYNSSDDKWDVVAFVRGF